MYVPPPLNRGLEARMPELGIINSALPHHPTRGTNPLPPPPLSLLQWIEMKSDWPTGLNKGLRRKSSLPQNPSWTTHQMPSHLRPLPWSLKHHTTLLSPLDHFAFSSKRLYSTRILLLPPPSNGPTKPHTALICMANHACLVRVNKGHALLTPAKR